MKYRIGFVSNSSSTSFTCCLTGEEISGMDLGLSDAGMYECKNEHIFSENLLLSPVFPIAECREWAENKWCDDEYMKEKYAVLHSHITNAEFLKWFTENEFMNEMLEDVEDSRYDVDPKCCPVCQFEDLPYEDVAKYYLLLAKLTRKEFAKKMKRKFKTYNAFSEYLKGVNHEN